MALNKNAIWLLVLFIGLGLCGVRGFAYPMPATAETPFYECGPLNGQDEHRIGINLSVKRAGYFDNDTTTVMEFVSSEQQEIYPPQTIWTFRQKKTLDGQYILYFNQTALMATLLYAEGRSRPQLEGQAPCRNTKKPWDL
jgi:hypothetical protein